LFAFFSNKDGRRGEVDVDLLKPLLSLLFALIFGREKSFSFLFRTTFVRLLLLRLFLLLVPPLLRLLPRRVKRADSKKIPPLKKEKRV
jgi:hypothetical protein